MPIKDDLQKATEKAKKFGGEALDKVTEYGSKAYDGVKGVAKDADNATGNFLSKNIWLIGGVVAGLFAMFGMEGGLMPTLFAVAAIIGGIFMDGKNGMFGAEASANTGLSKNKNGAERGKGKEASPPDLVPVNPTPKTPQDKMFEELEKETKAMELRNAELGSQKIAVGQKGANFILDSRGNKMTGPEGAVMALSVDATGKVTEIAHVKSDGKFDIDDTGIKKRDISKVGINLPLENDGKGNYINLTDRNVIETIKALENTKNLQSSVTSDKQENLRTELGGITSPTPISASAVNKSSNQLLG